MSLSAELILKCSLPAAVTLPLGVEAEAECRCGRPMQRKGPSTSTSLEGTHTAASRVTSRSPNIVTFWSFSDSRAVLSDREWNDHLSIMLVVQNHNLPCFCIVMANVKQYFVNKLSRVLISIIQGSKFFSTTIGNMIILGR